MATKAELQAELTLLRRKLAEIPEPIAEAPAEEPEKTDPPLEESIEKLDLEHEIGALIGDFENFPHKQALLFALGVFALGFLVGRTK